MKVFFIDNLGFTNSLIEEFEKRGYNHKSPIPMFKWEYMELGKVDSGENIKILKERCNRCRRRIENETSFACWGSSNG